MQTLVNFFVKIPTIAEVKKQTSVLRTIRPLTTKEFKPTIFKQVKVQTMIHSDHHERKLDKIRALNPMLIAQMEKRQRDQEKRRQELIKKTGQQFRFVQEPKLEVPSFLDYQDFFQPILRLQLKHIKPKNRASPSSGYDPKDYLHFDLVD